MEDAILFNFLQHSHLLPSIASLHMACILHDHTLATFLPPLSHSKVLKMWQGWAADVERGSRFIIMVLAPLDSASSSAEVAGVVMLNMPFVETRPFRAEVLKLFTSPNHRRKGIAKRLMVKLEEVARKEGTTLLVCRHNALQKTRLERLPLC
jgi:GNAT superfamily N-acetyltransferase